MFDLPDDDDQDFIFGATPKETEPKEIQPEPTKSEPTYLSVIIDGDVKKIFKSQPSYAPAETYLSEQENLEIAEKNLAAIAAKEKAIKFQIEELRREFGAKLAELNDQLEPLSSELFDLRRAKREAERRVETAMQLLREALNAEKVSETFKQKSLEFDQLTLNLSWREHAFEHQITGAKMIASAGSAILGDKMGLGKTLTSLIACDMMQSQKILVIVPDDVVTNFMREIAHWAPHRSLFMLGKLDKMMRGLMLNAMDNLSEYICVMNYSAWRKDKAMLDRLVALRFDTVIMDEAHSVKNTSTSAFKGCAHIIKASNSCPKCRGKLQDVYDDSDRLTTTGSRYLPRNFKACIGDKGALSTETVKLRDLDNSTGCGWTELVDVLADVKREYGALRSVRHVIPMTGTVILNKPTDIFALLNLIDPQHYDSEAAFIRAYCEPDPYQMNKFHFKPGGLESLTKKLAGKYIARDRHSAGVVLPKQDVVVHDIELDETVYAQQAKIIKQLSRHAMIILDSGKQLPIFATIALITRKRQANVWPAGIELKDPETGMVVFSVGDDVRESIKLDKVITEPSRTESGEWEGLIPDLTAMGDKTNGERVVVFSQFKGPLAELERRCKQAGISVVRFDGDTPDNIRAQVKVDFDRKHSEADGYEWKWQVVLANYKTGGVGLNFTHATQTIMIDEEWNAGKEDQARGRTDRIGQTEESTVHILRLSKTIDTWMANLIEDKRNMVEGFERNAKIANSLLDGMRNGDML